MAQLTGKGKGRTGKPLSPAPLLDLALGAASMPMVGHAHMCTLAATLAVGADGLGHSAMPGDAAGLGAARLAVPAGGTGIRPRRAAPRRRSAVDSRQLRLL